MRGVFSSLLTGRSIEIPPPALLALLYGALIAVGTVLLRLDLAAEVPVTWSDAIFTAVSAVTVTGLIVLDTGSEYTMFGQAVIMVLIQLGGLGLMTFAALLLSMLGLNIGIPHRVYLREDLNQTSIAHVLHLVNLIVRVVLVCELIGFVLLAWVFVPEFGWAEGSWQALFHSVSAFNNAGFSLFPDSLSRWVDDPVVNLTVPALFIIGGLGFVVISQIYTVRGWRHLSLHTKLMLSGTAALIVLSVTGFAALEWDNPATLGRFDHVADKLQASWFQAVTTRTAGFNTVDIGATHDSTSLMMIALMLIGAGSTSTAGGIKVTTFVVLLLAVVAFFKKRPTLRAFNRSLGYTEVMKVLALTVIWLLLVTVATFAISISHDGEFLDLAFEVASALGTVGLSRGATDDLDAVGRTVICILMFLGRVGPLTLGFFLATDVPSRVRYPTAKVYLG